MTIEDRIRKARKVHICDSCRRSIYPGKKYHYMYGCAEFTDKPYHVKVCAECVRIAEDAEAK